MSSGEEAGPGPSNPLKEDGKKIRLVIQQDGMMDEFLEMLEQERSEMMVQALPHLLAHLSERDLKSCRGVCTSWRQCVNEHLQQLATVASPPEQE